MNVAATGNVTTKSNLTLAQEGGLDITGDLDAEGDVTLGDAAHLTADTARVTGTLALNETSVVETQSLQIGDTLYIQGSGQSGSDYRYTLATSALDDTEAATDTFNVHLKDTNVVYAGELTGVGTTILEDARLTLPYDDTAKLGATVEMRGAMRNQLTLTSDGDFVLDDRFDRFTVTEPGIAARATTENIIEFQGNGTTSRVTFSDELHPNHAFAGGFA